MLTFRKITCLCISCRCVLCVCYDCLLSWIGSFLYNLCVLQCLEYQVIGISMCIIPVYSIFTNFLHMYGIFQAWLSAIFFSIFTAFIVLVTLSHACSVLWLEKLLKETTFTQFYRKKCCMYDTWNMKFSYKWCANRMLQHNIETTLFTVAMKTSNHVILYLLLIHTFNENI